MLKRLFTLCITICAVSLLAKTPSLKADHLVIKDIQKDAIIWMVDMQQAHYTMVIVGPDGVEKRHYSEGEDAIFEITNDLGELRSDGLYKFEITFSPIMSDDQKEIMQQLRDNPSDSAELRKMAKLPTRYESVTGNFRILDGAILIPENLREVEMQQALMEAAKGGEFSSAAGDGLDNGRDGDDKPNDGWDTGDDEGGTEDVGDHDFDEDSRAQVISQDLVVLGSECIGMDCVNGENFGFDTLRLKENNLRIKFMDTSNSASFPSRDWQITANDSTNGGAEKFSIDDIDGGRTPFTIEASAPSHSLYVDDGGRIGVGTSTPVVEMHVVDGDSPTLRLEQDGSSGFQAQTWDVAGNETNFFVRDATNGSRLPFKIRPSAPTNSLFIDTDGDIGLGDATPDAKLDIDTGDLLVNNGSATIQGDTAVLTLKDTSPSGASTPLVLEGPGSVNFRVYSNLSSDHRFDIGVKNDSGAKFVINQPNDGDSEFSLDGDGNLIVLGTVTAAGTLLTSDVNKKENFEAVDNSSILQKVLGLSITKWNFIDDPAGTTHLGPVAQDFFGAFGLGESDKHINVTDSLGVALSAIQGLHSELEQKDMEIQLLKERLDQLEQAVIAK